MLANILTLLYMRDHMAICRLVHEEYSVLYKFLNLVYVLVFNIPGFSLYFSFIYFNLSHKYVGTSSYS